MHEYFQEFGWYVNVPNAGKINEGSRHDCRWKWHMEKNNRSSTVTNNMKQSILINIAQSEVFLFTFGRSFFFISIFKILNMLNVWFGPKPFGNRIMYTKQRKMVVHLKKRVVDRINWITKRIFELWKIDFVSFLEYALLSSHNVQWLELHMTRDGGGRDVRKTHSPANTTIEKS